MTTTAFTGPLSTFTQKLDGTATGYSDQGFCLMSQKAALAQNSTNAVSSTIYVPQGSQLTDFNIDVTTAFDSATSATLTIGTAAAGTQYVGSINAKTAGRAAITFTAAQLTAMLNVGTNTAVVITVTPVGATTAGAVTVTAFYVQQPQAGDTP
jgi:hypothetical protein